MNKRAEATARMIRVEKQGRSQKEKSKKSVYIYIAALFIVVLLFILLSYFIQQRNNSALQSLNADKATAQQNIQDLQITDSSFKL